MYVSIYPISFGPSPVGRFSAVHTTPSRRPTLDGPGMQNRRDAATAMARRRDSRGRHPHSLAVPGGCVTPSRSKSEHIAGYLSIECVSSCRKMPEYGRTSNCGNYVFRIITSDDEGTSCSARPSLVAFAGGPRRHAVACCHFWIISRRWSAKDGFSC
jgi:hypothetical protein